MVGRVSAFLGLVDRATPELLRAFARARPVLGTSAEPAAIERAYAALPNTGFSERVLVHGSRRLATVRVKGVDWSDWGNPARVFTSFAHARGRPSWMRSIRLAG